MRRFGGLVVAVAIGGWTIAGAVTEASADGGPITLPADTVLNPAGSVRYASEGQRGQVAGRSHTLVTRASTRTGHVLGSLRLAGAYAIPAVAYDRSGGGLSWDQSTLVLRQRSSLVRRTSFAILDARRLRLRRTLTLPGLWTFDAISPDGSRLYLIHYPDPRNLTRYAVRGYDLAVGRLLPHPIVDPSEHGEQMRGVPITRAVGSGGRWDYTLYDGMGKAPFIHALDTVKGRAVCIDGISALRRYKHLFSLQLALTANAKQLWVLGRHEAPIAAVDTRTLKPTRLPPLGAPAKGSSDASPGTDLPWILIVLGAGLVIATASIWGMPRLHRRRIAGGEGQ
jgi:hypothetical protein